MAVSGAWRGNTAALPQDKLALPDMESHFQVLFFKLTRKKHELVTNLGTRYQNEHPDVSHIIIMTGSELRRSA